MLSGYPLSPKCRPQITSLCSSSPLCRCFSRQLHTALSSCLSALLSTLPSPARLVPLLPCPRTSLFSFPDRFPALSHTSYLAFPDLSSLSSRVFFVACSLRLIARRLLCHSPSCLGLLLSRLPYPWRSLRSRSLSPQHAPPRQIGLRILLARARPVPFCFQGRLEKRDPDPESERESEKQL